MREEKEAIRSHYDADPLKEWDRLQKRTPYEKYITTHMMDRYIQPGSRILDIGGGPGQYSIHYARQGHTMTLLDLSDENVRFAKKKARQYGVKITAVQGDATDLSRFPDNSFDTVFLMGPLYHLLTEESRIRAIQEAKRVLKPGGRIILFCPNRGYPFETHGIYWKGEYHFGNKPFVNYLPRNLRDKLAPHVNIYTRKDLEKLFEGLPVKYIYRSTVFGAYDNIIQRHPQAGKVLRSTLQDLEKTPFRFFGLSHFWVIEKTADSGR